MPREDADIDRAVRARGLAERGHQAERREAIERFVERVLADRIVDHREFLAAGDLVDARDEILAAVVDRMVAAIRLGERRLLVVADRADHGGAEMLGPLADDQPDPAGRGVDQDRLAGFTTWVRRIRYQAVMPFSIIAAPCWSVMPSGSGTSRSAGMTRASLYAPSGPPA